MGHSLAEEKVASPNAAAVTAEKSMIGICVMTEIGSSRKIRQECKRPLGLYWWKGMTGQGTR